MANSRSGIGPEWLVMARDISDAVQVDGQPTVAAALVMDIETGLLLGSGVDVRRPQAVHGALSSAMQVGNHQRAPRRVVCPPDLAAIVERQAAVHGLNVEVDAADPGAEAEEVFDSLVGHLAGRRQPRDPPSAADWSMLFRQARAFVEAQPWHSLSDTDLLDVTLLVAGEATRHVGVVLGNAGITRGFALYPAGTRPRGIRAGGFPRAGTLGMTLDRRADLPKHVLAKARRYQWPGRMNLWPVFFGWTGSAAADLSADDMARLTIALTAALHQHDPAGQPQVGEIILARGQHGQYTVSMLAQSETQRPIHDRRPTLAAPRTIEVVVNEFLADCRQRLAPRTARTYESVVQLLCACLNNYGYQGLSDDERRAFDVAYNAGDEQAFCRMFSPDKIVENIGEFLNYFMIRKVMAGAALLRASGTVSGKLVAWLAARGYITPAAADEGLQRARSAARDLPRAARLAAALDDAAMSGARVNIDALADGDYIEDQLTISRVEPGKLWFDWQIGPIRVPRTVSDLAREGWMVSLALGRVRGEWRLLQVGNVYPV